MNDQTVTCPNCRAEIPLNEVLTSRIRESLMEEVTRKSLEAEERIRARETKLREMIERAEERQREIDGEVAGRVGRETERLKREMLAKAEEELGLKLRASEEELAENRRKLTEFREQEIELRKKAQRLEEEKSGLELEVTRRIDAERAAIAEKARKEAAEEQALKFRERDALIVNLQQKLADAQRRIEQGSQERQGEMLEQQLADLLRAAFPRDEFEDVKRGARGADVIQTVRNESGKSCGRILWESKNTKDFSRAWLPKLKTDQQEAGADLAVLMSRTLPQGVDAFDRIEDVWVTGYPAAAALCTALREGLIRAHRERNIARHQEGLRDLVYMYVTGREFTTRVRMIFDAYQALLSDLESEKRAMMKIWKSREKRISIVLENISGMRGELEGMVGDPTALPGFAALELDAIVEDSPEEES